MLQVQQDLLNELDSQLSSSPLLPEQLSTWAEHPVTLHFLNAFRYKVLDWPKIYPVSACLAAEVGKAEGYSEAVLHMEEMIETYRKGGGEDE